MDNTIELPHNGMQYMIDLGEVSTKNEKIPFTFKVNKDIQKLKAGCGCTTPLWDGHTVNGVIDGGKLNVGKGFKTVTVTFMDQETETVLLNYVALS